MTRTDRFGVEVRERTMWDIREGVVGAETFVPKHVVICTWKNMTFAGGIDVSLYKVSAYSVGKFAWRRLRAGWVGVLGVVRWHIHIH